MLWCEKHNLPVERRAALDRVVRLHPSNAAARGLLGQVLFKGRWVTPEAVSKELKEDQAHTAKFDEYNTLRDRIDRDTEIERRSVDNFERSGFHAKAALVKLRLDRRLAPEHLRLGEWCDKNGLKPEALAHFTAAVYLNPYDAAAWHHLGYVKHHGRWMNHEQIVAEERETLAQKHADRHWEPLLRKWARDLASRMQHAAAEVKLAEISDPRAVSTVTRLFASASPAYQAIAVRILGQIAAPAASQELAAMAVYSDDPSVRHAAALASKGAARVISPVILSTGFIHQWSSKSSRWAVSAHGCAGHRLTEVPPRPNVRGPPAVPTGIQLRRLCRL